MWTRRPIGKFHVICVGDREGWRGDILACPKTWGTNPPKKMTLPSSRMATMGVLSPFRRSDVGRRSIGMLLARHSPFVLEIDPFSLLLSHSFYDMSTLFRCHRVRHIHRTTTPVTNGTVV